MMQHQSAEPINSFSADATCSSRSQSPISHSKSFGPSSSSSLCSYEGGGENHGPSASYTPTTTSTRNSLLESSSLNGVFMNMTIPPIEEDDEELLLFPSSSSAIAGTHASEARYTRSLSSSASYISEEDLSGGEAGRQTCRHARRLKKQLERNARAVQNRITYFRREEGKLWKDVEEMRRQAVKTEEARKRCDEKKRAVQIVSDLKQKDEMRNRQQVADQRAMQEKAKSKVWEVIYESKQKAVKDLRKEKIDILRDKRIQEQQQRMSNVEKTFLVQSTLEEAKKKIGESKKIIKQAVRSEKDAKFQMVQSDLKGIHAKFPALERSELACLEKLQHSRMVTQAIVQQLASRLSGCQKKLQLKGRPNFFSWGSSSSYSVDSSQSNADIIPPNSARLVSLQPSSVERAVKVPTRNYSACFKSAAPLTGDYCNDSGDNLNRGYTNDITDARDNCCNDSDDNIGHINNSYTNDFTDKCCNDSADNINDGYTDGITDNCCNNFDDTIDHIKKGYTSDIADDCCNDSNDHIDNHHESTSPTLRFSASRFANTGAKTNRNWVLQKDTYESARQRGKKDEDDGLAHYKKNNRSFEDTHHPSSLKNASYRTLDGNSNAANPRAGSSVTFAPESSVGTFQDSTKALVEAGTIIFPRTLTIQQ